MASGDAANHDEVGTVSGEPRRGGLGGSFVMYGCAFALAGATPFVLLPFLTSRLSPAAFGEMTAFLMLAQLIGAIASLSTHGFASVRFFKIEGSEFARLVGTILRIIVVSHLVAAVVVGALHPLLVDTFPLSAPLMSLCALAALCINGNAIFLAIFQSSQRPLRYLTARALQAGLEVAVCVGVVLWVSADESARIASFVCALLSSALYGLVMCARAGYVGTVGGIVGDPRDVRAILSFGLPLLPHVVAGSAIGTLDRLVVSTKLGPDNLGVYMVAMQIGLAMMALIEPANKALAPWLFGQLQRGDDAVNRSLVARIWLLCAGLLVVGVVVTAVALLAFDSVIDAHYTAARPLIPFMVTGFVCQGMYYGVVNIVFFAERTGVLSLVSGTTAVVGFGLSTVLTERFGLHGAAASFALNSAVLFVLTWVAAARCHPMPWFSWWRR